MHKTHNYVHVLISKFCSRFFFYIIFFFIYFISVCQQFHWHLHTLENIHNTQFSEQIFNITDLKCTSEEMNPHVGPMLLKVGQRKLGRQYRKCLQTCINHLDMDSNFSSGVTGRDFFMTVCNRMGHFPPLALSASYNQPNFLLYMKQK